MLTCVSMFGGGFALTEQQKRFAATIAETQKGFKPVTWELAKTLIYAMVLPFSLIYHHKLRQEIMPKFEAYKRELETREGAKIAAQMEADGYGNPDTVRYRQEYNKRLATAKDADSRYNTLSRMSNEHQSGAQGAATMFMTYMIAWQNHLSIDEFRFLAYCQRIVERLHIRMNFSMPDTFGPSDFIAVYKFMKNYRNAWRNEK